MKIPTQQNNIKRSGLVVAALAIATGVAIPTATFAQGGDRGSDRNGSWHQQNRNHKRHGWNTSLHKSNWSWWQQLSAAEFTKAHEQTTAKLDKAVSKYSLQIENSEQLRADINTNAEVVAISLTALEEVRNGVADKQNPTDEERVAIKEQSVAVFSAYYDYKLSLQDYLVAIKDAANTQQVRVDRSLDSIVQ